MITNEWSSVTFGREIMHLLFSRDELVLRHTFTISRSSRTAVPIILVSLEKDGLVGDGEASPNARYGETVESVSAFLKKVDTDRLQEAQDPESVSKYLDSLSSHDASAKASIDIALHDWIGKRLGVPVYSYFGLQKPKKLVSSFTIGIDTPDVVKQKVMEAKDYPILKVKVGMPNDEQIITAVRSVTDKPLRVDANEGWKSKEEALEKINWLAGLNVELVEQPMPANRIEDVRWLRERVDIPIVADEALQSIDDIEAISTAYDGVNVKVQKLGGLYKTKLIIQSAKRHGLKVMIGCMIESSVGITAAAHLASLADWIDLDGNVLITNDPFIGAVNRNGEILLYDGPGLGIAPAR